MRRTFFLSVLICLVVASGCRMCCWGKRASEKKCPTDIRKTHFWCFGEDALFRYPCGPKHEFYGHRPTCWREWPASGDNWRDVYCGPPVEEAMDCDPALVPPFPLDTDVSGPFLQKMDPFRKAPIPKKLDETRSLPNPFKTKPEAEPLPPLDDLQESTPLSPSERRSWRLLGSRSQHAE